jgi:hypothetical protein
MERMFMPSRMKRAPLMDEGSVARQREQHKSDMPA